MRRSRRCFLGGLLLSLPLVLQSRAATAPGSADLVALAKRVEERTIALRELGNKKPIRWEITSKEKVRAYLLETLKQQYGPGEMEQEGQALKALGLVPRSMDYQAFVLALFEEQVGGYYDPKKEVFYLADWISPALQESIISHELTHALQDQNFKIDEFVDRIRGNSDAMYARSAVAEGDATLLMLLDSMRAMGLELDFSAIDLLDGPIGQAMMSLSAAQFPRFSEAPKALREAFMFPYLKGLVFVSEGRKRGGWKRIDQVYSDIPISTEQILHPEKYFDKREKPALVSLDFLDKMPLEGWKKTYDDVLGEFMILQLLDPLKDLEEEKRAAAGWNGDRLRVYQRADELGWVQLSRWDSDQDAVEFAGALAKTVASRLPAFVQQPLGDAPQITWKGKNGAVVLIERRGDEVLVVENLGEEFAKRVCRGLLQ